MLLRRQSRRQSKRRHLLYIRWSSVSVFCQRLFLQHIFVSFVANVVIDCRSAAYTHTWLELEITKKLFILLLSFTPGSLLTRHLLAP